MRTEVVGEAPPAVELPEGEIHPAQTAKVLERDEVPGRCKQSPAVRQRLLQVACRVQYVGRDGQVVAVEVEALFDGVLLDIERAVLDASPAIAEACLRFREEARRDVGVHVVEAPFGELRQHRRGRGSRTRSDLDHPEPPSRRERDHERADRLAQHLVRRARHRRPQVEIGRGRLSAAEEQRQGIGLPPKHVGERATGAPEQPDLGQPVGITLRHPLGMPLRILGKRLRPRIPGSRPHQEGVVLLRQHPGSGRHLEHPAEEALVFRVDVQRLAQLLGPDSLPDLSDPSQPIQVCDREGLRPPLQVRQQVVPTPGIDPGIAQVVREEAGAGLDFGRVGEEIRGLHSGWQGAFLPRHFVEQIVDAFDRREQRRPRGPLDGVAAQCADRSPVRVVQAQVPAPDLGRTARLRFRILRRRSHAYVAEHSFGKLSGQPEAFPGEGQVGRPALRSVESAGRAHDLEAAVEQERMKVQIVPSRGFGERYFSERLSGAAPDTPQSAKRRTQLDAGVRPRAVVGRRVQRRKARNQAIQVDPRSALRGGSARRHASLHVDRPFLFTASAEYPDTAGHRRVGSAEQHLHGPAVFHRPVPALLLGEHERVVQLHLLHRHPAASLGKRRRCRHGAVERAGRHHAAEHAMVAEPHRVGGEHFRLVGDFTAGGLVPDSQQRMTGRAMTPFRRLQPVTFSLEGIIGYRDPTTGLAREEPVEPDPEPRLVGFRDRVREPPVRSGRRRLVGGRAHARNHPGRRCGVRPGRDRQRGQQ